MDSACHGPEQQDDQEMPFHISMHQAHRSFLGFQGGGEANVTFLLFTLWSFSKLLMKCFVAMTKELIM